MSAISRNMDAQTPSWSADLTAPLVSPEIVSSFEALLDGRCSLSELNRSVLEACRSDPESTDGVLLQLEGYATSGEFDRFDFGPLKRALEGIRHPMLEIRDPTPEIRDLTPEIRDLTPEIRDPTLEIGADPVQESNAGPAPLSHVDIDPTRDLPTCDTSSAMPNGEIAEDGQIDETSTHSFAERVDHRSEDQAVAFVAKPNMLRDRYILEAEIGRGGVGTVYRALDLNRAGLPREHQYVALKLLRAEAARRPDAVQALRREYHQAQLLSHPGIVNVFDFDHEGGTYFVTMELLEGESLGALTRRLLPNKLPPETAIRILRELGDSVAYAHDRGVLHLDLKPDNVMIDAEGHVRVLDFGLAQTHMEPWLSETHASPAAATPAYASCERLVQERPDVRDDIFSFSCIAYELLTGKHPFDRHSALHARKDGLEARRIKSLSHRQWDALKSGLAWAREDRPATMRELLQGLALQSRVPPQTAPTGVMWRPAVALGLLVLGTTALLSWDRMHDGMRESVDDRASAAGRNPVRTAAASRISSDTMTRAAAEATTPGRADNMTPAPAADGPGRSHDEPGGAAPVELKPESEAEADHADAGTRDAEAAVREQTDGAVRALAAAAAPPEGASATATPSTPDPAPAIESASAVAEPPTPASDVLGFSRHSFSISEADSVARVNVRRIGSATGDISFQWYTVADSASAVQDYVFEFGEERMAPGQTTTTLVVQIVEDSIQENPELLQVVIANPHGARVGPAGRVPVIIVDDD
jgi:serine/threonine protein kinase